MFFCIMVEKNVKYFLRMTEQYLGRVKRLKKGVHGGPGVARAGRASARAHGGAVRAQARAKRGHAGAGSARANAGSARAGRFSSRACSGRERARKRGQRARGQWPGSARHMPQACCPFLREKWLSGRAPRPLSPSKPPLALEMGHRTSG